MRTRVELIGGPDQAERVREVAELLVALRDHGGEVERVLLRAAPGWLADAFAPERTVEEAEAWLVRWRAAPDRLAFERASGWTASSWVHWFSPENEFWSVGDVRVDAGGHRVVVDLEHDDDPVPFEALRWLAFTGGLRVG
ncbi:hypothetical protein AB0J72_34600 [Dactylosporangium sp. NPDC049742]|uniref:hypothetical protein n=1 Tax=Dactylosporangium sp. NPDC049742 TaxID=3154737 RepID=UPI0034231D8C